MYCIVLYVCMYVCMYIIGFTPIMFNVHNVPYPRMNFTFSVLIADAFSFLPTADAAATKGNENSFLLC